MTHRIWHNPAMQVICLKMLLPHLLQILRANHQWLVAILISQRQRDRDGCQGLTQTDDITEHGASAHHHPSGQGLHCCCLVLQQFIADPTGKGILIQTFTNVSGHVVADLQEHVIWMARCGRRPRLIKKLQHLRTNRQTPVVIPPGLKPLSQLRCPIFIHHVRVQLQI